jgi:hypothetical protein
VDARLGCFVGVVKFVAKNESWCDEFVYECLVR